MTNLYGNFTNRMMENSRQPAPQVGMGATVIMYSDRHAATIVAVKGRRVCIQEDRAVRVDDLGMTDSGQRYRYKPNAAAPVRWFSRRKNGRYVEEGAAMHNGTALLIGERDAYHDYSF